MEKSFATTCCDSRIWRIAAVLSAALVLAGCIAIPTPTMPVNDIPAVQREALMTARATRVDILLRFGEPDLRLDGDRVLVYRWDRTRAVFLGFHVGGTIEDVEAVFLEFGQDGRLSRIGTATAWRKRTIADQAEAWARDERPQAPR